MYPLFYCQKLLIDFSFKKWYNIYTKGERKKEDKIYYQKLLIDFSLKICYNYIVISKEDKNG